MIHNKYDFKLGISFSLFCLMVLIFLIPGQVGSLTEPEALMPILITIFILILSLILTIQSVNLKAVNSKKELQEKSGKNHKLPAPSLLYVMAIMIAYAWMLDYTGFLLTSVIGMVVLFFAFKVRKLKQITIITGVTLGILYITFEKLLYSPLPVGTLIENLLD